MYEVVADGMTVAAAASTGMGAVAAVLMTINTINSYWFQLIEQIVGQL